MEDWLTAFYEEKQRQNLNNLPLFFSNFFCTLPIALFLESTRIKQGFPRHFTMAAPALAVSPS
jgi:hypothetical protein